MAQVFERDDVLRIGVDTVAGRPMAVLMVLQSFPFRQFYNRATLGKWRSIGIGPREDNAPRNVSYNLGAGSFNLLMAAFLIYSFVDTGLGVRPRENHRGRCAGGRAADFRSRGFVLNLGLLLFFAIAAGVFNRRLLGVTLQIMAGGVGVFFLLTLTSFFRRSLDFYHPLATGIGASGAR